MAKSKIMKAHAKKHGYKLKEFKLKKLKPQDYVGFPIFLDDPKNKRAPLNTGVKIYFK
jgi:hypothetical protein